MCRHGAHVTPLRAPLEVGHRLNLLEHTRKSALLVRSGRRGHGLCYRYRTVSMLIVIVIMLVIVPILEEFAV